MTHLSLKAEKIHNELLIKNLIFKELKWYRNPIYIHHFIIISTALPMFILTRSSAFPFAFLIWGVNVAIVQFFLFSHINKLIGKKYKIELIRKGLYWVLPDTKYQKKDTKLFYKKMILKKVLFGKSSDIELLNLIEEDLKINCINKTTSYPIQSFFKKGTTIVTALFILFATLFLDKSINFQSDAKLVIGYSTILLLSIFIALYTDFLILNILNIKYRKQKRFLNRILRLKLFLKLRYNHIVSSSYKCNTNI